MGDGKAAKVEAIGIFMLLLKTDCYLELKETYVVPSFRRNLISVSVLDKSSYHCSHGNGKVSLFIYSNLVGIGSLISHDNLYLLNTIVSFNETLHSSSCGTQHKLANETSAML